MTATATHQAPSIFQQAIYEEVQNGTNDIIVNSVAGSGKTTTLVGIANLLDSSTSAIFMAFNKEIAVHLGELLPAHVPAKTFNSFGFSILRENRVSRFGDVYKPKYRDIIEDLSRKIFPNITDEEREELNQATYDHVNMARLNLTGANSQPQLEGIAKAFNEWKAKKAEDEKTADTYSQALIQQATDYDLPLLTGMQHTRLARLVANVLVTGIRVATGRGEGQRCIDLTDQVWLPVVLRLPTKSFDFVMVDEAQDLKRCELNLISKARRAGGRMVFVGDRNQSIYLFAGADCGSMDRIQQVTGAQELPLSICYRCPQSHIDLAASIYKGIEAKPGAPKGELVYDVDADWAIDQAVPSDGKGKKYEDLFLCRNTAPLLKIAYRLIRQGKPARVRGKQIGQGLVAFAGRVNGWNKRNGRLAFAQFPTILDGYLAEKCREARENLHKDKVDAACEALSDKVETIRTIYQGKKPASFAELKAAILSIFDDEGSTVWLSSVHRAKGLEANRIFLIEPQLMPSKHAKTPQARQQEMNILYVAVTRSKHALYFLRPIEDAADEELAS